MTESSLPRLNEPAPDFLAETTLGPRGLEDYAGKWLVLFSHPADFTPVCTSEFVAFSRAYDDFRAMNCELLGLSVDSRFAHIAWIRNIKQLFDVDVPFPVIEDISMTVANAYGMIQPGESDTAAVRAIFVIDPDGVVRAMLYYPLTVGRSVDEVLRLVRSLQVCAEHRVATPEGWQAGDQVIMLPPQTVDEAASRRELSAEYHDWYFSEQEIPKP